MSPEGFYHQLVVAQHYSISTDSPLVTLGKVGYNDLQSGSGFVKVSCNLVSLNLVVNSLSTNDYGNSRSGCISEILGLKVQTRY